MPPTVQFGRTMGMTESTITIRRKMTRLAIGLILLQSLGFACNAFVSRSLPAPTFFQLTTISQSSARDSSLLPLHATQTEDLPKTENPRLSGLALMLDDGTRKSHSMAENTAFVTGFFKGLANRDSYGALLTSLYFVYTAMEDSMTETGNEGVRILDNPALRRLPSLERDMGFFYGENWKSQIEPSPSTKIYVGRVEEVAKTKPYLLVAHQYTRYLGDLFGGQMMGGMARRSLQLEDGSGTSFYEFEDIPSTNNFITGWYQQLNELDLTEEQKKEIVDEANYVFALNIGILQELEGSPLKAFVTLAISSLKAKLGFA